MKYIRNIGLVIAILLVFNCLSFAEEKYGVRVDVKCNDDVLKSSIESFIKRELRSLGNIYITDTKPYLKLAILAKEMHSDSVISAVVTFIGEDGSSSAVMNHLLLTGCSGIDNIRGLCISLIVEFESTIIEPMKGLLELMKSLEKGKKDEE